jgi:predicted component of type VI protein secretion system
MKDVASITATRPGYAPRRVDLSADSLTIGRSTSCDLILEDDERFVSRLHCTVDRIGGAWWLYDNESRSGVYVRGKRVEGRKKLADGDIIRIVQWELTFHDPYATEASSDTSGVGEKTADLCYHLDSLRLFVDGKEIEGRLSPQEHRLLACLFRKAGAVCTKKELNGALWEGGIVDDSALASLVRRLREKIEPDPSRPVFVVTVPGFGYRLDTNPPQRV